MHNLLANFIKFFIFLFLLTNNIYGGPMDNNQTINITQGASDHKKYFPIKLPNSLQVLIIEDPAAEKAAAALTVNIGDYQDPEEHLGFAHFLEHMLFLGTSKYPEPNGYQDFINQHGGTTNASTGPMQTTYQFDITPEYFKAGLDRFAQFFISPLFNADCVDKERNAVDSEFNLYLKNDDWRLMRTIAVISNPLHPKHNFHIGNLDTLSAKDNATLRNELINFYHANYSANNMQLVIVSPLLTTELKSFIADTFSAIPNRELKIIPNPNLPFTPAETKKDVQIKSLRDENNLFLLFPIPRQLNYIEQPSRLMLELMRYKGKDSLYDHLKNLELINSYSISIENISDKQDLIAISFVLTKKGATAIDTLTSMTLDYADWLLRNGLKSWIYEEQKKIDNIAFNYQEAQDPLSLAVHLSRDLEEIPVQDILIYPYLQAKSTFNQSASEEILRALNPNNMIRILMSQHVTTDKKDKLFDVDYSIKNLDINWPKTKIKWRLKQPNKLLPNDFTLVPNNNNPTHDNKIATKILPEKIFNNEKITLWHKQHAFNALPFTNTRIAFITGKLAHTPYNIGLSNIYGGLIKMLLEAESDRLADANIKFKIYQYNNGFCFEVDSFSQTHKKAILYGLDLLNKNLDEKLFNLVKEDYLLSLQNYNKNDAFRICFNDIIILLDKSAHMPNVIYDAVKAVNLADLKKFITESFSTATIEILCHGNIDKKEAMKNAHAIQAWFKNALKIDKLYTAKSDMLSAMQLERGKKLLWQSDIFNKATNALVVDYQIASPEFKNFAYTALLSQIIHPPLFAELRTKQQLGYIVGATNYDMYDTANMVFYVESPNYKPVDLKNRLESFLNNFTSELQAMSEEDFAKHKKALIANLIEEPKQLDAKTFMYWKEILNKRYKFDRYEALAELVNHITKAELLSFYEQNLLHQSSAQSLIATNDIGALTGDNIIVIKDAEDFKRKAT